MWSRRSRARAAVWAGCGALAITLAALSLRSTPSPHHITDHLEQVHPARVAHLLADFTVRHPSVRWEVVQERNNLTWWGYEVRYECGARCEGAVTLHASSDPPPHDRASTHRVYELDRRCEPLLPLFSWPTLCEQCEVEQWVRGGGVDGGGAVVESTCRCGGEGRALDTCRRLRELLRRALH